jgi:lipopolysaccharide/colanic/teichoic acid biosynthesis glycosyltransferase
LSPAWKDRLRNDVTPAPYFRIKGAFDFVVSLILLIPGLPLIGLLMLLTRLTSRGPGIYRQIRVGKGGREFEMYKIRTMTHDAEAATGPVWTKPKDARITRVGRVLRKLHLDELPQLFNVLRGDMSLIGPRPERPEFLPLLSEEIPGYLNRLTVRPGVTGLAQINLPPDTDLRSVRRKLVLDLEYIQHAGFFLDLRMFICTLIRLLGFPGVVAMHLMVLHREVSGFSSYIPSFIGSDSSHRFSVVPARVADEVVKPHVGTNGEAYTHGDTRSRVTAETTPVGKPR